MTCSGDHPYLDDDVELEDLLSTITLDREREGSILALFVLIELYEYGLHKHSLDVVRGGWQYISESGDGNTMNDLYAII